MYCSNCGKEISDDSKFCYSCGSQVEIKSQQDTVTEPPPVVVDKETQTDTKDIEQTTSENEDKKVISSTDVNVEITNDIKDNEPLSTSKTKGPLEDKPIFQTIMRDKIRRDQPRQPKQRHKWGWGWFVLVLFYSNYYGKLKRDDNLHTMIIEFLGFFVMLILYFWIRNYLYRYYDDYKPSLISGIISIFLIVFLVELLYHLFILL